MGLFFGMVVERLLFCVLMYQNRDQLSRWKFRDGSLVDEEFGRFNLKTIRAACSEQSKTQWTKIASRDRLYQFVSMSDETTQWDIRHSLGLHVLSDHGGLKR